MRKWGIQKFLNRPEHEDGGFIVGSITPNSTNYHGFQADLTVADCDRRIHLDFSPYDLYRRSVTAESKKRVLDSIRQRREKVKVLRQTVNKFCDKMEQALDEYESNIRDVEVDKADQG